MLDFVLDFVLDFKFFLFLSTNFFASKQKLEVFRTSNNNQLQQNREAYKNVMFNPCSKNRTTLCNQAKFNQIGELFSQLDVVSLRTDAQIEQSKIIRSKTIKSRS
jgi:hypothetical protein